MRDSKIKIGNSLKTQRSDLIRNLQIGVERNLQITKVYNKETFNLQI